MFMLIFVSVLYACNKSKRPLHFNFKSETNDYYFQDVILSIDEDHADTLAFIRIDLKHDSLVYRTLKLKSCSIFVSSVGTQVKDFRIAYIKDAQPIIRFVSTNYIDSISRAYKVLSFLEFPYISSEVGKQQFGETAQLDRQKFIYDNFLKENFKRIIFVTTFSDTSGINQLQTFFNWHIVPY